MVEQSCATWSNVVVYYEPGRFGGWPANRGIWSWSDEIVVGFERAYYEESETNHSVDRQKPSERVVARSLDGGETWDVEDSRDPDAPDGESEDLTYPPDGIDCVHPDFAMRFRAGVFSISYDRCRTWTGPYRLPTFGAELTARTDYIVNGASDCHVFLSAAAPDVASKMSDRAFCARTTDGGETFQFLSWMTSFDDKARSVMPSTVRCSPTTLVSALRRRIDTKRPNGEDAHRNWIDVYRSTDDGLTWEFLSKVADTAGGAGHIGNPPALTRLGDGRLCVAYGYRGTPCGIRTKLSGDGGATWGCELVLRDDGRTWDLGYPRMVQRSDGKLVTIYYFTTHDHPEQHIAATIWDPDLVE